jgi:hypothetical protein
MLSVDRGCAAGIIVGFDEKTIYVATAAHVADLSTTPFPPVTVKFEGLANSGRLGRFWPKFESQAKGDLAVVTVDRDEVLTKFLNDLDFAMLSSVPLSPADSPVTSIGCFGGGEWSSVYVESQHAHNGPGADRHHWIFHSLYSATGIFGQRRALRCRY